MTDKTTPYANCIFEQPWWLDIVAAGQWHEVFVKDECKKVIARMAYVLDGRNIFMPKMTQTLGIWMDDEVKCSYEAQTEIIEDLLGQLPRVRNVTMALSPDNNYIIPFCSHGYSCGAIFTYRITCLDNLDVLYANLNKTAKKNIKYARNKVKLYEDLNFANLWELQEKTYKAQKRGNPLDRELLKKIVTVCQENGHGKYLEAKDDEGHLHSCAFFVFDEKVCYYLIGASDSEYRNSGAQSLILWEGIKFAAEHSKVFDFEGSNIEGIENFFRQFGGGGRQYLRFERQPYGMISAWPQNQELRS